MKSTIILYIIRNGFDCTLFNENVFRRHIIIFIVHEYAMNYYDR